MHEVALAEGVVKICEDHARKAGASKVTTIRIEIGELSHVVPDALAFCFDAVAQGTISEGARLDIDRAPGRAWCHDCGHEVPVGSLLDLCPDCGGVRLQVTDGEQMRVKEMEVT